MWMHQRVVAAAAAIALTAGTAALEPSMAAAQPTYAHASHHGHGNGASSKILVKTCSPTRSETRSPVGPRFGYTPGFYPGGPYFWDDAYGYPYYQRPVVVNHSASLQIDYVNITPQTMETIDFGLIANGRLVAEVRDVGTFSPNIEIKHAFGLNPNVFPLRTALPQCVPLRITYRDQATWVNPHLPRLQRAIYESP
jgi:hypothetical protein